MLTENTIMPPYEDVNREIQNFLASKSSPPQNTYHEPKQEQSRDILPLLESLCSTYNEINNHLRSGDSEALKDVILKSDVKMSLVCETLLETLRRTTEMKNQLIEENKKLIKEKSELEEKEAKSRVAMSKLESEMEYKNSNLNELNRIIKDQKDKMNEYKNEISKLKSEAALSKVKIEELENLRRKSFEKMGVYEKEIEAINAVLKEKDSAIQTLSREKREEENKNSTVKTKVVEMERMIEILNKKIETKEKSLNLCNVELSKLLNENKAMKTDYEKFKENSAYYEGLYNNLNKQNSYLNAELNKLIKAGEFNKDSVNFVKKYRKKAKKYKKLIKKLEEEKNSLKKELGKKKAETIITDTSDTLIKRIDELTMKNKDYRARISSLENDKNEIERKLKLLEKHSDRNTAILKTTDRFKEPNNDIFKKNNIYSTDNVKRDVKSDYVSRYKFDMETKPFDEMFTSPSFVNPIMPELKKQEDINNKNYMKMFNLSNDYPQDNNFHGGLIGNGTKLECDYNINDGLVKEMNGLEINKLKPEEKNNLPAVKPNEYNMNVLNSEPKTNLADLFDKPQYNTFNSSDIFGKSEGVDNTRLNTNLPIQNTRNEYKDINPSDQIPKNTRVHKDNTSQPKTPRTYTRAAERNNPVPLQKEKIPNPFEDEPSADSIKTYHTTSTLKDMIARTDNLQKKFENLEEQLANIKDGNTEKRLNEKIKTYNNNYSELNIDSDDPDFI